MYTNYHHMQDTSSENTVLAMAFVNVQQISSVYDTETGFDCGTIFPCLNKPLTARRTAR